MIQIREFEEKYIAYCLVCGWEGSGELDKKEEAKCDCV